MKFVENNAELFSSSRLLVFSPWSYSKIIEPTGRSKRFPWSPTGVSEISYRAHYQGYVTVQHRIAFIPKTGSSSWSAMTLENLLKMTESKILQDIADFEAILSSLPADSSDADEIGLRRTYTALLATRRDMLARLQTAKD